MDSSELLVLCSGQPGFLRALGAKLIGKCRLLECYSLAEAAQMIQLHHPRLALIDLRNAVSQRLDRSFAMAHNSETTILLLITNKGELSESSIPVDLAQRIVHIEVDVNRPEFEESVATVDKLLQVIRRSGHDFAVDMAATTTTRPTPLELASARTAPALGLAERYRTETPALRQMLKRLEVAARHDVTILLIGETGSGKTHLARLIHESSSRANEPFLTVACGALPGELIESELFGHAKGSFTSAHADKKGKFVAAGQGTILLDEIDVLTPEQQVKLLRVIEQGLFEAVGTNGITL